MKFILWFCVAQGGAIRLITAHLPTRVKRLLSIAGFRVYTKAHSKKTPIRRSLLSKNLNVRLNFGLDELLVRNQHAVPVGEKAVALFDGLAIGVQDGFATG